MSTITAAHTLDALETLLGWVEEVDARGTILFPDVQLIDTGETSRRETVDQLTVLGRTVDGCAFVADINGGIAPEDARFTFEVRGTEGWLRLSGGAVFGFQGGDLELTASIGFDAPDRPAVGERSPAPSINVGEVYARLAHDLRSGSRETVGFEHGVRSSKLIASVTQAARSGVRQKVTT